MCLVAARFFKVIFVNFFDHGVFVRFANGFSGVVIIKGCGTQGFIIGKAANSCRLVGLAAAVNAAAWATHNFNKVELLAVVYPL